MSYALLILPITTLLFAIALSGADGTVANATDEFTLDSTLTAREIILASTGITGSKHDFSFNASLTPKGECSACHNIRIGEPLMWSRSLTEEQSYFTQTSNPNYIVSPTIYCYDCHDNHDTVDNDPDYRFFINESLGRYIPQDVAFDSNLTDKLAYNSTPLDTVIGFYETAPPNSVPPIDGRPTGGHSIKSNPSGLTNINQGDKLPCTDCHEPHNAGSTNEVFIRGSVWFPLGGKVVSNLKASNNTRSGTGTGRAICANCHAYSDSGTPVRFVDVNPSYGSTDAIIQTPPEITEHLSTNLSPCTDCHTHDANCGRCHGSPPYDQSHVTHYFEARGPALTSCLDCHLFSTGTHKDGDVNFRDGASQNLTTTAACDDCHSPGGAFDGVNDTVIGAKPNWASGIYNGSALKAGKEQWCVGCHDDVPANSKADGLGVAAPNIAGKNVTGNWQSPVSIVANQTTISNADNLIDNNLTTGTGAGQVVFDLGASVDVSHIRLYTSAASTVHWKVYGSNNLVNWTRILYGPSLILAGPSWLTGEQEGWNEIRMDGFISVRYIKLEKISGWPVGVNSQREFEYKTDLQYGYYITGHKVNCTNCHNTSTVHLDGIAQTYRANFDNYQSGYRLKSVDVDGEMVPPLNIPRDDCNWGEYPRTSNDFALCFGCHDNYTLLGDASGSGDFFKDPLQTNFRNSNNLDGNGKVSNEHLRHLRGRGYCGLTNDWDSDWDGTADSPPSCTACHNVHGSPTLAMTRHGELASTPGTIDKVPMFNLIHFNIQGESDRDLANISESIGARTQFYASGAGTIAKNKMCNMCHNDLITYYRTPVSESFLMPTAINCSNLTDASVLIDNNLTTGNTLDTGTAQYVVFDLGSNYTVNSIRMYTDGNSYTWNVSMGNDTAESTCCNYSDWGTLLIEDWQTTSAGWTERVIPSPKTGRYLKLMRSDGSGDLNVSSLFEFMFDPPEAKLTYELHSYADLHIYDLENRHVGMNYATGELENQIPGAVCSFGEVQSVSLPKLAVGEYRTLLKGTGDGSYELTVTGESEGREIVSETFTGTMTENEMHDATTAVNTADVTTITITVEDPPQPTVRAVGVANVTLVGLYPELDEVDIIRLFVEKSSATAMPDMVESVRSAYMIDAFGSGPFTLRFDDVESADEMIAVYKIAQDGSGISLPFTVQGSAVEVTLDAGESTTVVFTFTFGWMPFDTGPGAYPSIAGTHNGTIKPNQTIKVSKIYTYPCPGTTGHTEYVRIYDESGTIAEARWSGYTGDWHNISFDETYTFYESEVYNYTIRTGSYPQIIHNHTHTTFDGSLITCTEFRDANGNSYTGRIPAIRLWAG